MSWLLRMNLTLIECDMKNLMRVGIYFAIYIFMTIGAVMSVQHSWWYMIPSVIPNAIGLLIVEYYARNWNNFN